jgi:hypothetical protein
VSALQDRHYKDISIRNYHGNFDPPTYSAVKKTSDFGELFIFLDQWTIFYHTRVDVDHDQAGDL